jgi:hypothetical protein
MGSVVRLITRQEREHMRAVELELVGFACSGIGNCCNWLRQEGLTDAEIAQALRLYLDQIDSDGDGAA